MEMLWCHSSLYESRGVLHCLTAVYTIKNGDVGLASSVYIDCIQQVDILRLGQLTWCTNKQTTGKPLQWHTFNGGTKGKVFEVRS